MEDLGVKFGRDKTFCFDFFIIDEILFDESDDITLYCRVPYFGEDFFATFGMTFEQLNIILRSIHTGAEPIAHALAEKLKNEQMERPSTLRMEELYSIPLEVTGCILFTTLYELIEEDDEDDDEDDDDNGLGKFSSSEEDEENEEENEELVAYAFLVDDIIVMPPMNWGGWG